MKYLPQGTTFKINNVLVGGLISISLPSGSKGVAETTDSGSSATRDFLPALRDNGTISMTLRHDPDDLGQQQLETNYNTDGSAALVTCVITLADLATAASTKRTYTFLAFVTTLLNGDLALVDDAVAEVTTELKISGPVTIGTVA